MFNIIELNNIIKKGSDTNPFEMLFALLNALLGRDLSDEEQYLASILMGACVTREPEVYNLFSSLEVDMDKLISITLAFGIFIYLSAEGDDAKVAFTLLLQQTLLGCLDK